jgi:protein-S-isoprenylcysteine O-methyltransferase Ste14
MIELAAFKIVQLVVIIVFAVFISDLRKKSQSPLISQTPLRVLKLCYLVPICIYAYTIVTLASLSYFDALALVITCMGTMLVAISKISLGDKHTWAGYCLKTNKGFRAEGVYSYVRHPLYTGIFVFSIGGFFTFILNSMWFLSAIVVFAIISFLAIVAKRETAHLSERFGEPFNEYKKQVHPFLPLRRFRQR